LIRSKTFQNPVNENNVIEADIKLTQQQCEVISCFSACVNDHFSILKRRLKAMLQGNSASSSKKLHSGQTQLLKSTAKCHYGDSSYITLLIK